VRLELRDNAGALVGSNSLTLQALSQQQNSIGTYFPGVDLSNAQNLTLSFDASAAIDAYSSVIDNTSTDPIFVPAQQDAGVAASQ
jgi:ACT domain-containing protein